MNLLQMMNNMFLKECSCRVLLFLESYHFAEYLMKQSSEGFSEYRLYGVRVIDSGEWDGIADDMFSVGKRYGRWPEMKEITVSYQNQEEWHNVERFISCLVESWFQTIVFINRLEGRVKIIVSVISLAGLPLE